MQNLFDPRLQNDFEEPTYSYFIAYWVSFIDYIVEC